MHNSRDDLPDIRNCLKELCTEISVANKLDDDIRRELLTHMEDKFTAYINGDEPLTEEDAFVLVREHFGDPVVIQTMYREVEAMEDSLGFMRKAAVALILTVALMFLGQFVIETSLAGLYHFMLGEGKVAGYAVAFLFVPELVSVLLPLLALFFMINRIKNGSLSRTEEKIVQAHPLVLLAVFSGITLLFYTALRLFLFHQASHLFFTSTFSDRFYSHDTFTLTAYKICEGFSHLIRAHYPVFICLAWLHFFDAGSKRILNLIGAGIGFIATNQLIDLSIFIIDILRSTILRGSFQYISMGISHLPNVLYPGTLILINITIAATLYAIIIFAHTIKNRFTPAFSQT